MVYLQAPRILRTQQISLKKDFFAEINSLKSQRLRQGFWTTEAQDVRPCEVSLGVSDAAGAAPCWFDSSCWLRRDKRVPHLPHHRQLTQ
ncbi:hypothetical protein RRG08_049618 [Elysia crispata]|uniref:Uncharacterized protein n=1 Tax=Elysia crispata TaxID=231223 RepID=A0AAE1E624_9GAST|nr:hypothetical protein RRG08_049618 [Elysia crispata]